MSSHKTLGRIYIKITGNIFQVASIKVGRDGDIYIAAPLGQYPKGNSGIRNVKFSYHPDGEAHMTSLFNPSIIGVDMRQFGTDAPQIIRNMGLGYRDSKIYSKGFGTLTPLSDIKEVMYTKFGISYHDIATINSSIEMLSLAKANKIASAEIIDVERYKDFTMKFYIVPCQLFEQFKSQNHKMQICSFKHPIFDLELMATIEDRWSGDKSA